MMQSVACKKLILGWFWASSSVVGGGGGIHSAEAAFTQSTTLQQHKAKITP